MHFEARSQAWLPNLNFFVFLFRIEWAIKLGGTLWSLVFFCLCRINYYCGNLSNFISLFTLTQLWIFIELAGTSLLFPIGNLKVEPLVGFMFPIGVCVIARWVMWRWLPFGLMVFAGGAVVWTGNCCREFITHVHRNIALETNPISGHWKAAMETAALGPPLPF